MMMDWKELLRTVAPMGSPANVKRKGPFHLMVHIYFYGLRGSLYIFLPTPPLPLLSKILAAYCFWPVCWSVSLGVRNSHLSYSLQYWNIGIENIIF